ncbi:3464_t:CDS:2, partial [Dentiscutata heterogama]
KLEQSKIFKLAESQELITIMFDVWKMTPDIMNIINTFLACASSQNFNVVAMIMDSASAYAST